MLFVILATILTVSVGFAAEKSFKAKLTGNDEVPSVKTKAKGDVKFKLSSDGKELSYKLHVKNIENSTAAHIHRGKKGARAVRRWQISLPGRKRKVNSAGTYPRGPLRLKTCRATLWGKSLDDLVQTNQIG